MAAQTPHLLNILRGAEIGGAVRVDNSNIRRRDEFVEDNFITSPTYRPKLCILPTSAKAVTVLSISPDGTKIAVVSEDTTPRIVDVNTCKCVKELKGHRRMPTVIKFHPRFETIVASGCPGGQVRVWDITGDQPGSEVIQTKRRSPVSSIAFHPFAQIVAYASENEVRLWNWKLPNSFCKMTTHKVVNPVRYINFDRTGMTFITGIENSYYDLAETQGIDMATVSTLTSADDDDTDFPSSFPELDPPPTRRPAAEDHASRGSNILRTFEENMDALLERTRRMIPRRPHERLDVPPTGSLEARGLDSPPPRGGPRGGAASDDEDEGGDDEIPPLVAREDDPVPPRPVRLSVQAATPPVSPPSAPPASSPSASSLPELRTPSPVSPLHADWDPEVRRALEDMSNMRQAEPAANDNAAVAAPPSLPGPAPYDPLDGTFMPGPGFLRAASDAAGRGEATRGPPRPERGIPLAFFRTLGGAWIPAGETAGNSDVFYVSSRPPPSNFFHHPLNSDEASRVSRAQTFAGSLRPDSRVFLSMATREERREYLAALMEDVIRPDEDADPITGAVSRAAGRLVNIALRRMAGSTDGRAAVARTTAADDATTTGRTLRLPLWSRYAALRRPDGDERPPPLIPQPDDPSEDYPIARRGEGEASAVSSEPSESNGATGAAGEGISRASERALRRTMDRLSIRVHGASPDDARSQLIDIRTQLMQRRAVLLRAVEADNMIVRRSMARVREIHSALEPLLGNNRGDVVGPVNPGSSSVNDSSAGDEEIHVASAGSSAAPSPPDDRIVENVTWVVTNPFLTFDTGRFSRHPRFNPALNIAQGFFRVYRERPDQTVVNTGGNMHDLVHEQIIMLLNSIQDEALRGQCPPVGENIPSRLQFFENRSRLMADQDVNASYVNSFLMDRAVTEWGNYDRCLTSTATRLRLLQRHALEATELARRVIEHSTTADLFRSSIFISGRVSREELTSRASRRNQSNDTSDVEDVSDPRLLVQAHVARRRAKSVMTSTCCGPDFRNRSTQTEEGDWQASGGSGDVNVGASTSAAALRGEQASVPVPVRRRAVNEGASTSAGLTSPSKPKKQKVLKKRKNTDGKEKKTKKMEDKEKKRKKLMKSKKKEARRRVAQSVQPLPYRLSFYQGAQRHYGKALCMAQQRLVQFIVLVDDFRSFVDPDAAIDTSALTDMRPQHDRARTHIRLQISPTSRQVVRIDAFRRFFPAIIAGIGGCLNIPTVRTLAGMPETGPFDVPMEDMIAFHMMLELAAGLGQIWNAYVAISEAFTTNVPMDGDTPRARCPIIGRTLICFDVLLRLTCRLVGLVGLPLTNIAAAQRCLREYRTSDGRTSRPSDSNPLSTGNQLFFRDFYSYYDFSIRAIRRVNAGLTSLAVNADRFLGRHERISPGLPRPLHDLSVVDDLIREMGLGNYGPTLEELGSLNGGLGLADRRLLLLAEYGVGDASAAHQDSIIGLLRSFAATADRRQHRVAADNSAPVNNSATTNNSATVNNSAAASLPQNGGANDQEDSAGLQSSSSSSSEDESIDFVSLRLPRERMPLGRRWGTLPPSGRPAVAAPSTDSPGGEDGGGSGSGRASQPDGSTSRTFIDRLRNLTAARSRAEHLRNQLNERPRAADASSPSTGHCRIQAWRFNFGAGVLPNLSDGEINIVVPRAKIQTEDCVALSSDGRMLAAFADSSGVLELSVFSLSYRNLGAKLYTVAQNDLGMPVEPLFPWYSEPVSLSFSPTSRYLAVGAGFRRHAGVFSDRGRTVAKIYRLVNQGETTVRLPDGWKVVVPDDARSNNHGWLVHCRDIDFGAFQNFRRISISKAHWLPQSGMGLVLGTNRNQVHVLHGSRE